MVQLGPDRVLGILTEARESPTARARATLQPSPPAARSEPIPQAAVAGLDEEILLVAGDVDAEVIPPLVDVAHPREARLPAVQVAGDVELRVGECPQPPVVGCRVAH